MKTVDTSWDRERRLLITRLQGKVNLVDVDCWKTTLQRELEMIEGNATFKMVANLGSLFKPVKIPHQPLD